MAEVSVLSLKPKRKDINKYRELDDEWYSLGTELEFEDEELEELEQKYTDPHRRMVKIFDIWLKKGENPTYRKLIKALVDINKKDVAQSLCTDLGLTSSLDSLLDTASQAILSEFSPIPAKEADANIDTPAPVSDQSPQNTTASELVQIKSPATSHAGDQPIPLTDFSHQEQVMDDSDHTYKHSEVKIEGSLTDSSPQKSIASDANIQDEELATKDLTIDHSESKNKQSLIDLSPQKSAAHYANTQAKISSNTSDQRLTLSDFSNQKHSIKDHTIVTTGQTSSIDTSTVTRTTNEPHQIMLRCNDKLITALSLDPQGIAGVLLTKGLIPENTEAQMRQCSTPREKATILVTTIRQRIEIAPKRFWTFSQNKSGQKISWKF